MKKAVITICSVLCLLTLTISSVLHSNITVSAESAKQYNAKSVCLMDFESGEVLYEENADQQLPVASMVKLMTILLTLEEIDSGNLSLNELVTTSENASGMGGSQVFIDPFVEYSVESLLKSVIVASANDASVALAEKISGSEEEFVKRMNNRAKELSMANTNYINSTGLPAPMQHSTARDISKLNCQLLKHDIYHDYSKIWLDKLVHPSGRETELANTNKLIRYYKDCDSGKTGSTDEAGYCLSASAKRNDLRLIATIVGAENSKTRFNETSKLLSYGFANFEYKPIVNVEDNLGVVLVKRSATKQLDVFPQYSFSRTINKSDKSEFTKRLELKENVSAPVVEGEVLGKLIIEKDGLVIQEIPVVSKGYANKLTYKESISEVLDKWSIAS